MNNSLETGTPRLGWLIDGDAATPHVAVMLQDTGRQIILTVPTLGLEPGDVYAEWFFEAMGFKTEPPPRSAPRTLAFHDNQGSVALVGCRASGGSFRLPGPGSGQIVVNYAVLGSDSLKLEKINGIRTELPGLTLWSGARSIHTDVNRGVDTRVDVVLDAPDEVPLHRKNNLTLRPDFRASPPKEDGSFEAENVVQLVTKKIRPCDWSEHLESHIAVRDLLVVSAWEQVGFSRIEVLRLDDHERTLSGEPLDVAWKEVRTHRLRTHSEWTRRPQFLFSLSDIGPKGVTQWMRLRKTFGRAIAPLISVADQRGAFWETRMMLTGVALEALGYQLAIDPGGQGLNSRGQLSFHKAVEGILADMTFVPLDDPDGWVERAKRCYSGVKHADNPVPDSLEIANTQRENLLVMRFWVAGRLGCSREHLSRRLALDPLASSLVAEQ